MAIALSTTALSKACLNRVSTMLLKHEVVSTGWEPTAAWSTSIQKDLLLTVCHTRMTLTRQHQCSQLWFQTILTGMLARSPQSWNREMELSGVELTKACTGLRQWMGNNHSFLLKLACLSSTANGVTLPTS